MIKGADESSLSISSARESQCVSLKLMAVNEAKSKLIGLYQLKINIKTFEPIVNKRVTFDKCIDKQATLNFSANL